MKASGVQVLVRTLGHVIRSFSRLPKQVRYIALQRLAVRHPLNAGLAVRPFTTPDQDGMSNAKPTGEDNRVDNWASYILDQANRSGTTGEKWKEPAFLAPPDNQKPRRRLREWMKLGIALGAVLGTLGIAYESGWIKYQEAKGLFQAIKEGYGKEAAGRLIEDAKLYTESVSIERINESLMESLRGFRLGQTLTVGHETSIVLAPDQIQMSKQATEDNFKNLPETKMYQKEDKPKNFTPNVSDNKEVEGQTDPTQQTHITTENKKTLPTDKQYVDPRLQLDLIDFGPFIYKVLRSTEKAFILVDGMKGCGKSTSMQLLCSHLIQQGSAAVYLKFDPDKQRVNVPDEFTDALLEDPAKFVKLTKYFNKLKGFTVVLDDFNHYIKADRQNAAYVIYRLWTAASVYNARVIFTTSDYGLINEIRGFPGRENTRITEIRITPPPADQLTAMIKQALTQLGETDKEGNSDPDIEMYCETIGTLRNILEYYLLGKQPESIRKTTIQAFKACLTTMKTNIGIAAGDKKLTAEDEDTWKDECLGWFWRKSNEKCDAIASKLRTVNWRTTQVREILESLAKKRVFRAGPYYIGQLTKEMETLNIVRHCSNDPGEVDFHSYVEEVAIRALLRMPAEEGTGGKGTEKNLTYLRTHVPSLGTEQTLMTKRLKLSSRA